jgi:hypothetical protein
MAARKGQQKASKYAERLKKMKKAWAGSKAEYEYTFGGEKVAEGVYSAQLQDLQLAESKGKRTAGQLYIRREFVISEGEFEGVPVRDMMWIENEKGPVYLRRFIEMCGFDSPPEDQPELLEDVLAKMKKDAPKVKLQVVHPANFDGLNLRVQGMDSEDDSGEIDLEDLDDMDKKELKALVKDKELDIDGYRKMDEDDLREAVKEALSSEGSGDDDDDDDDDDADDLDEMDKKELRALVKSEELDIDGYRKMDEDDLRSAIRLARGDEDKEEAGKDEDSDSPDFDEMDEDELREYIEENEIDTKELGFSSKAKYKKASEDDIREALSAMNNTDDDDDGDDGELLKEAKVFCETWEVEVDEDADLDTVKEAIRGDEDEENSYPEKELDEDEVTLLEKLGLDDLIERKRKKGKK